MESLTVGSLFSGIGGLDLGLERSGMRVIWQSEIDPYASAVLKKHWPDVPNLGDITQIDWSEVERPDLVCGGFPCQPVSVAGRRKAQADDRWLWPYFAHCLSELRPRLVLLENVPGLLTANAGSAFAEVLGDLAALGFDAEWDCIPAAHIGAPHLRYRVLIVAHARRLGDERRGIAGDVASSPGAGQGDGGKRQWVRDSPSGSSALVEDSTSRRGERRGTGQGATGIRRTFGLPAGSGLGTGTLADANVSGLEGRGEHRDDSGQCPLGSGRRPDVLNGLFEPGLGRAPDGLPERVDRWPARPGEAQAEWEAPRLAQRIPQRKPRLKALGNAVVPQVAEYVGRRILAAIKEED